MIFFIFYLCLKVVTVSYVGLFLCLSYLCLSGFYIYVIIIIALFIFLALGSIDPEG